MVRTRIRELRLTRGLTQEELCEIAGISVDAVSRIEGGSRVPRLETLEQIADALGVSPLAFFEGTKAATVSHYPAALRRVISLLERHDDLVDLAEQVVTALVRARQSGRRSKD